jgi:PAS domain S-box-containing protein
LRFVRFNKAGEKLIGISRDVMLGKNDYDLFPKEQADFFIEKDREALRKGEPFDIPEEYLDTKMGKKILHTKKVTIRDEQGSPKYLLGISDDVTEIKLAEKKLKETMVDLERSNKELEQFAYVASHDLQEPLRTVASFCQLLEKRYQNQLDDKGKEYINYAVDGSKRMQVMIDELLSYARVGKKNVEREQVDLNKVIDKILLDLKVMVKESKAKIIVAPLPVVIANQMQMTQLFQNLIVNALKFKSQHNAVVEINAEQKEQGWEFVVKDNGIGIKEEYFEQIFVIFQRLHSKAAYAGTGIGLALCKKIVENYGGQIWVTSKGEQGTAFYFTIPI